MGAEGRDRLDRLQEEVLGALAPLPAEEVPWAEAAGRWLAAPVRARRPAPALSCSAMDGFAVRAADLAAGPAVLPVARTLFAGDPPGAALWPGQAARIFTGAPLPPGADAVVREEAARLDGARVALPAGVTWGEHVRWAGEDVPEGGEALPAGARVEARQLGLLAAVDAATVAVVRRPRVALLCTGDEVVSGRTPDSNGPALEALLRGLGAEVTRRAVGDRPALLAEAIAAGLAAGDAVVTVGGVSVGARDHVPEAAARAGAVVRIHGVPMKPGKPFLFALAGARPVLGLPGSPSACLVAFEVFARPALLRLAGAARPRRRALPVPLAEAVEGRAGRDRFLWARLEEGGGVRPLGRDAAQVRGPALADALVRLRAGAGAVAEGTPVETWLLEEG